MMSAMKTIHIAEMIADGGRDGRVEAPGEEFSVELNGDEETDSVTPEHLFGGAYAACFLSAVKNAAEKSHLAIDGLQVTSRTHLEEQGDGGYHLAVELRATLPGINRSEAEHLLHLAHQTCPYSKAVRGNVNVTLSLD
jgi:osmotically inducible protein OsmC